MELCEVCKLPAETEVVDQIEEAFQKTTGGWERRWGRQVHHFCRAHLRLPRRQPLPPDLGRRCGIESGGG